MPNNKSSPNEEEERNSPLAPTHPPISVLHAKNPRSLRFLLPPSSRLVAPQVRDPLRENLRRPPSRGGAPFRVPPPPPRFPRKNYRRQWRGPGGAAVAVCRGRAWRGKNETFEPRLSNRVRHAFLRPWSTISSLFLRVMGRLASAFLLITGEKAAAFVAWAPSLPPPDE